MDDLPERGELDWFNLTNWEQECIEAVERLPDLDPQMQTEKDFASQKLWHLFQNSATCVAQLYKDRQQNVSLWVPFQNAASSVTNLYKECLESQRHFLDLGMHYGSHRRNKDLLAWVKRRKRHIRREDLIAFLSGKSPPPHCPSGSSSRGSPGGGWNTPRQRICLEGAGLTHHHHLSHLGHHLMHHSSRLAFQPTPQGDPEVEEEADLQTFRDALSASSVGRGPLPPSASQCSPGSVNPRGGPNRHANSRSQSALLELNAFITDEFTRHVESCKRPASSNDVIMDSPTHKRSRLT